MKTQKTCVGDIVLIPIPEGYKPAKVLYVSQRYKDVILLGVYKDSVSAREMPSGLPGDFELLVYTSKVPVKRQRWHAVGNEQLRPAQTGLDVRLVAGEVWQGDNHLGVATVVDRLKLHEMLVMGATLLEKKAAALN
ncbi:hypothetical protein EXN22_14540 [Pseudomonas tructae]|uniref:Uncharacterized protein n=1 Tax=Pseudomonas tructae TaxID=2518644 RepID=A0A411MJ86_9PSED|nr:hypothetical protein [Pseudomonas tructae]QBF26851.1 hypothetical protein EXN22_14540 [Pseudomonas tructae]